MKVIETERLRMRRITADDAAFLLRLLNEPSFHRFIGDRNVRTIDAARDYVRNKFDEQYDRIGLAPYGVALRTSGELIGIVSLVKRDFLDDVDIGYAFLESHWSCGYAFEATKAVLDFVRASLGMARLVAVVQSNNPRSIKLLRRLGMSFERVVVFPGESVELELHAIGPKPSGQTESSIAPP